MSARFSHHESRTLREKQSVFAQMVSRLIRYAAAQGYEVTLGEAWRHPEWAREMVRRGKGISNSLHVDRLAIDLNLYKDGVYLDHSEAHKPLGIWWEQEGGAWGGRFSRPDGNHYSLEHDGRK